MPSETTETIDVAILGAGFSGLGMAIRMKQEGFDDFVVLEKAAGIGGTWWANTYPGCQCDVPSHLYSFSFAPNPEWSHTYARQPEILAYIQKTADEHGVRRHVRLNTEVTAASWDEERSLWRIETSGGPLEARVLVSGQGGLSEPLIPAVPGLESFEGKMFHSARWEHDHDLSGERVAVIGTGASSVQFVPRIQSKVGQMHVFQRTPAWVVPHGSRRLRWVEHTMYRRLPLLQRAVRGWAYGLREIVALGLTGKVPLVLSVIQRAAEGHLRTQVRDPERRAELTPDFRLGCKRIMPSNAWYPALQKPNVELVTAGVTEIRGNTVVGSDGTEREVDTIIFGTGFQVTEPPHTSLVKGRGGLTLKEIWDGSPRAFKGSTVSGFPNLFLLTGPNTGQGHTSLIYIIESQIAYVIDALRKMREHDITAVDVRADCVAQYNARLDEMSDGTVWTSGGCSSWYLDRNGRNATIWPEMTFRFRRETATFDLDDYKTTGSPSVAPEREKVAA